MAIYSSQGFFTNLIHKKGYSLFTRDIHRSRSQGLFTWIIPMSYSLFTVHTDYSLGCFTWVIPKDYSQRLFTYHKGSSHWVFTKIINKGDSQTIFNWVIHIGYSHGLFTIIIH